MGVAAHLRWVQVQQRCRVGSAKRCLLRLQTPPVVPLGLLATSFCGTPAKLPGTTACTACPFALYDSPGGTLCYCT